VRLNAQIFIDDFLVAEIVWMNLCDDLSALNYQYSLGQCRDKRQVLLDQKNR